MQNENLKKGIFFGTIMVILIGLQPIIANSRPAVLDAYIFAAMTCIIQALIFFPIMKIEKNTLDSCKEENPEEKSEVNSLLYVWKKHKRLLMYIGINFSISQFLFYLGFELAGSINGALAQKTTVIFGLLFGYLINKEEVSITQIIFSFVLLFGVTLAITEGSFNLLEFNVGVLIIFITTTLWMLAHAITKPLLVNNEATPVQLVFIRNGLSGSILLSSYFLFHLIFQPILFPEKINLLFEPINIFFFIAMGAIYGFDLFCWYKLICFVEVSKASVIASPTPIVTAFFAIFLGEIFTIFHLLGLIIIIISIYIIVRERKEGLDVGNQ
ncbi:MAG: DMT family transporter [Candidatus Helarchaeota archaeon]|nr:DMT family transporter [Candidatus Helarchaeota archaeon]